MSGEILFSSFCFQKSFHSFKNYTNKICFSGCLQPVWQVQKIILHTFWLYINHFLYRDKKGSLDCFYSFEEPCATPPSYVNAVVIVQTHFSVG